jgi:hypothetical protein
MTAGGQARTASIGRRYLRLAMAKRRDKTARILRLRETATARLGPPYTFLRNEPTVLADDFLCIIRIIRYLYRLQTRFAGGFVLENEPTGGVFFWGIHGKVGRFPENERKTRGYLRGVRGKSMKVSAFAEPSARLRNCALLEKAVEISGRLANHAALRRLCQGSSVVEQRTHNSKRRFCPASSLVCFCHLSQQNKGFYRFYIQSRFIPIRLIFARRVTSKSDNFSDQKWRRNTRPPPHVPLSSHPTRASLNSYESSCAISSLASIRKLSLNWLTHTLYAALCYNCGQIR